MKHVLVIMFMSLLIISCSYESEDDNEFSSYSPQYYSSLEEELKKTDFSCENLNECPKNVGLVYINSNGSDFSPQVGRCTGFLVDDEIVGTNSHCIPKHLKAKEKDCSGQLAIRFLSNQKESVFGCEELLDYSPLGLYDPDYAFFRIKPSGIKPFSISQEGIRDNQHISIARVTPSQSSLGGTLSVDSCRIALGSLLNLKATNRWAETGLAVGCEAISGNSGSPVLNENGEVIGILQSKMKDQFLVNLEHNFKRFGLKLPSEVIPHFTFTNLSCVESNGILTKNQKCEIGKKLAFDTCLELDKEENEKRASRVIDIWKRELPNIFLYKFITNVGNGGAISAEPLCVKTEEQVSSYDSFVKTKGIIGFRKNIIELSFPRVMKLGAKLGADHNLRLKPNLRFSEDFRSYYEINLEQKSQGWIGSTNSTLKHKRLNFSKIKVPVKLRVCNSTQIESGNLAYVKMMDSSLITEEEFLKLEEDKNKAKVMCEK